MCVLLYLPTVMCEMGGAGGRGAAAITVRTKASAEEGIYSHSKVIRNKGVEKCTTPYGNDLQD